MATPETQFSPGTFAVHRDHVETALKLAHRVHRAKFRASDDDDELPDGPDGDRDDDTAEDIRQTLWASGENAGSLAIINVCGILMRGCPGCSDWGLVDYEELLDEIHEADNDANVKRIVLVVDSPGGMLTGCPEAAAAIAALTKPLMVFTSGMLCSAAYWLAASADMICATQSSDVGSIGVYRPFWDVSAAFGQMGIAVQLFTSGAQKGAGYPGTSLTPDQAALIQTDVDKSAGWFQEHVATYRPQVDLTLFDGRSVSGEDGAELGIVDAVVADLNEAVGLFLGIT